MKKKMLSTETKLAMIQEYEAGSSTTEICRKYSVNRAVFYRWKKQYYEGGIEALTPKNSIRVVSRETELERENEELKKLLGEKELRLRVYEELLKKTSSGLKVVGGKA